MATAIMRVGQVSTVTIVFGARDEKHEVPSPYHSHTTHLTLTTASFAVLLGKYGILHVMLRGTPSRLLPRWLTLVQPPCMQAGGPGRTRHSGD